MEGSLIYCHIRYGNINVCVFIGIVLLFLVGLRYPGYDENAGRYHSEKRKGKEKL